MCGIGGCVVRAGERPDSERLEAMRMALDHRGPDDSGMAIERNVGLVHARLSIVDPTERAAQPMREASGRWLLSYNGEVFNHLELRRALPDAEFTGTGDTETVLHAFDAWGSGAVSRFAGMFALAALDTVEGRLLLARDPVGVKPLYLARSADAIWFASEIGALIAAGIPARASAPNLARSIDVSYCNGRETLIEGIERLEPGCLVSVDTASLAINGERYFSAPALVDLDRQRELERRPRAELTGMLAATLRSSVHDSLMADVPIGTMCSGGLDSSLITALAREQRPDLLAFAASSPADGELAEGPAAIRVAEALGLELEMIEVTPESWRAGFVAATRHFDGPLANASAVSVAQIAARARRRGVKALLTGEGADELFGGYGVLHGAALGAFLPRRTRLLQRLDRVRLRSRIGVARQVASKLRRRPSRPEWVPLTAGRALDFEQPAHSAELAAYAHHPGARGALEAALIDDLELTLPQLLNRMDKNCMQFSVEARVPFLEKPLIELALNLPLEHRVGPRPKGVLRDVAATVLPRRIANRPKVYGMLIDGRSWIADAADPAFLGDGILRETLAVPRERWQRVLDTAVGSRGVRLWSAEVWSRSILGGASDEAVETELWR